MNQKEGEVLVAENIIYLQKVNQINTRLLTLSQKNTITNVGSYLKELEDIKNKINNGEKINPEELEILEKKVKILSIEISEGRISGSYYKLRIWGLLVAMVIFLGYMLVNHFLDFYTGLIIIVLIFISLWVIFRKQKYEIKKSSISWLIGSIICLILAPVLYTQISGPTNILYSISAVFVALVGLFVYFKNRY